jgi:predicted PurR-regulated permease PerM
MNVGGFVFGLALMAFCLFFFFSDGPYLAGLLFHAIPIRTEYTKTLSRKFIDITRNLFMGYILVALFQAVMAYLVFVIFRVNGALVFAAITFVAVFIPILGGGLVWIPLGIARIIADGWASGLVFIAISAAVISGIDTFLRPWFLKDRIQLHPLIIFLAILGGLSVFGFNGIILGPVIFIFFLTVLDLFLNEHNISERSFKKRRGFK